MKVYVVAARAFIENQTFERLCETRVYTDKDEAMKRFRWNETGFYDWLREGDIDCRMARETDTRTVVWGWPYVCQVTIEEVEVS